MEKESKPTAAERNQQQDMAYIDSLNHIRVYLQALGETNGKICLTLCES